MYLAVEILDWVVLFGSILGLAILVLFIKGGKVDEYLTLGNNRTTLWKVLINLRDYRTFILVVTSLTTGYCVAYLLLRYAGRTPS
jgi:uncharacterized membrane protein YdjX (TVP38/TMEM64 family)